TPPAGRARPPSGRNSSRTSRCKQPQAVLRSTRGRLLADAAECLEESGHGVELPSGKPAEDFFYREGSRVELIRDLWPLERRGDRRAGDGPQHVRRDGMMTADVLHDVDIHSVVTLRL